MDYSTEKYALIKNQWNLIHNPQTTSGLLDGMEEGAMMCLGIFDDCKDVMAILRQVKAAAANRQKVTIRKDAYPKGKVFNAYYLDVAGETYDQLRVVYTPVPSDVAVDPLAYTRADRDALAADGTVYRQRGIDFADGGRTVFTIEIGANEDVYEQKYEKLKEYLFGKGYDEIKAIFANNSVLTPDEIKDVREQIALLKDEDQKKELYLKLQEKVPYHNQQNNNQPSDIADRMCNLTSEAMCLEYLGISCPDPNMQFEDFLEKVRSENNYGDRTTPVARQKVAEYFGACYHYKGFNGKFSQNIEKINEILLPKLQSGCAVMISVWPKCKGHLVRLQGITEEGLIVDDPNGKVKGKAEGFDWREACNSGGYNTNSDKFEDTKGNDNLWKWVDIKDVTIKYVEIYCKCK